MSPGAWVKRSRLVSISGKYEFTSSIKESRTDNLSKVFDMLRAPTYLVPPSSCVETSSRSPHTEAVSTNGPSSSVSFRLRDLETSPPGPYLPFHTNNVSTTTLD